MSGNGEIEKLISCLSKLPGLGIRSAQRIALHLLRHKETDLRMMIHYMRNVYLQTKVCEICGNVDSTSPCSICSNPKRDASTICVVADIADLWAIENSGFHKGKYHILGNKLSAVDGITPANINVENLYKRIKGSDEIKEVIIALSADLEGQTTLFYIKEKIAELGIKTTTLAHGVPIGSSLENLDNGTLVAAFTQRRTL